MRVGFLSYSLDTGQTGIGRYMIQLMRALKSSCEDVAVVLLATEPTDRYRLAEEFETYRLRFCAKVPGLLTIGNVAVASAARRYKLDVIHDPNGIAPFFAPSMGAKRVVTIHDAFARILPGAHNGLDNWRFRWQLPLAARMADAVITVSTCSQVDLIKYLHIPSDKVQVIANGVDGNFTPVDDGPERQAILERYGIEPPYLFYVGGINARKNIARLFDAFACVRTMHPDLTLVIGGKRQWRTAGIDETIVRLNLGNRIHFTGYVDDSDLPALYSAASVFVFPSLYEGFGLPPLESMACGTPVVASNSSSLPEVLGDAAVLVDPLDVTAIAGAICRVLEDRSMAEQLRRRGLAHAREFSWERTACETVAVYNKILGRAPRGGY
jgi:glycosyltransferase involved in cell wall biosynthesis